MSASLWIISTFSTPDSFNLMFPGPMHKAFIISDHRYSLVCLTNHPLLFLISVRLVKPCCWKEIAPFGKKLSALHPLFFPSLMECTFPIDANRLRDVYYWYTNARPHPIPGSLRRAPIIRHCAGFSFPDTAVREPWQTPDSLQTRDTARQQSGSIQSVHCIRGHFHVLPFASRCKHEWDSKWLTFCKFFNYDTIYSQNTGIKALF